MDLFSEYLAGINKLRSHYPWSTKVYESNNIENVYLIESVSIVGFVECSWCETNIEIPNNAYLYLHEIHVAPSSQRRGVGESEIKHLQKKGATIQMTVAKENHGMMRFLRKIDAKQIYDNIHTVTMAIESHHSDKDTN